MAWEFLPHKNVPTSERVQVNSLQISINTRLYLAHEILSTSSVYQVFVIRQP